MRIGVFGGTFDPPHQGHLILAAECLAQLKLDRLLWVLTSNPPHKTGQTITLLEDRLAMVQAAIQDDPSFELSRVDIDRPAPYFAVDTLHLLAAQFPGNELFYLLGGDSLHDLPIWHDPTGFLSACAGLGVMRRPGDAVDLTGLEKAIPGVSAKVHFIEAPLLEISSREIRQRVMEGRPFRYYLPPSVYEIVRQKRLYRQS
jgi:nicotinate-nucleotide adenylyltransferase